MAPLRWTTLIAIIFVNFVNGAISLPGTEAQSGGPPRAPWMDLARTPPMGWNSWNRFQCDVSEQLIRETADAIVASGMKDAGYQYVVIDDCWQVSRDGSGTIVVDRVRFPSGMKALADYVHGKGLKFGLYSDAGTKTCQLQVGNPGMAPTDNRAHFSFWALLAAPLMAGNDVRTMTTEVREILLNADVIAISQDALGRQGRRIRDDGDQEVWSRPLDGGGVAVILFNRGKEEAAIPVAWHELGLPHDSAQVVRDVWQKKDLGAVRGTFSARVPPRDVVMVRVGPVSAAPR